jgi:small subunit ribosomal protein S14
VAKKAMINKEARREMLAAKGKISKSLDIHNRCSICGRPHGFHRDFGLCRICLRKMAHQGLLPGVNKSKLVVSFYCIIFYYDYTA